MMSLMLAMVMLAGDVAQDVPERPREAWVFRSILDQRPRVVTVALHEDLWIAYDATNCGLYRAWHGDVRLDGAVYTTVHGPQPRSRGRTYANGLDGDIWHVRGEDGAAPASVRWLGYAISGGQVHLRYELTLDGGARVKITERPEYRTDDDGQPILERLFSVEGLPAGATLELRIDYSFATGSGGGHVSVDGPARFFPVPSRIGDDAPPQGTLRITENGRATLNMHFHPQENAR